MTRRGKRRGRAGWARADRLQPVAVHGLRRGPAIRLAEFVASRADEDGVLVLSRFAGAAVKPRDALLVTPQLIDRLAATCRTALVMTEDERRARMRKLRHAVAGNDIFGWGDRMARRIRAAGRERRLRGASVEPPSRAGG